MALLYVLMRRREIDTAFVGSNKHKIQRGQASDKKGNTDFYVEHKMSRLEFRKPDCPF